VTQRMMADIRALKGKVDPGPALRISQECRGPELPPTEPKKGVADFR
jgi:hypothetical protein